MLRNLEKGEVLFQWQIGRVHVLQYQHGLALKYTQKITMCIKKNEKGKPKGWRGEEEEEKGEERDGEGGKEERREKAFQGKRTIWIGYEKGLSWNMCNSLNK